MTPESVKLLNELRLTNYGKALTEFLNEKYKELNDVRYCTSWDDTLARAKAVKIIDEIFSFMKEKQDVSNKARYD